MIADQQRFNQAMALFDAAIAARGIDAPNSQDGGLRCK